MRSRPPRTVRAPTPSGYLARLGSRARFYRFFFLPPLYLALPFFLPSLRQWRFVVGGGWRSRIFSLGTNFYPYFYPHYIAAETCLFVLVSVVGLERLGLTIRGSAAGREAAQSPRVTLRRAVSVLVRLPPVRECERRHRHVAIRRLGTDVNHGDPEGRIAVRDRLAQSPGKQLVFVRYWPQHRFEEWIQNAADIDNAPVVWALDRGAAENENLRHYYPDRTVWLLEPDARPPKLSPLPAGAAAPAPAAPKEQREKPSPVQNGIQLLPIQ